MRAIAQSRGGNAFGGIVSHLDNLDRASRESAYSPAPLVAAVTQLEQMLWHAAHATNTAPPAVSMPRPPSLNDSRGGAGPSSIAFPPLIGLNETSMPAPPPRVPSPSPSPSPQPRIIEPNRYPTMASVRGEDPMRLPAPPVVMSPAPIASHGVGQANVAPPRNVHDHEPVSKAPSAPKLLLKTVLHLRAFGKAGADPAAGGQAAGTPPAPSAQQANSLLGFKGMSAGTPNVRPTTDPLPAANARPSSFPVRRDEGGTPARGIVRERERDTARPPRDQPKTGGHARRPSGPVPTRLARGRSNGPPKWLYLVGGGVALLGVGTIALVVASSTSGLKVQTVDAGRASVASDASAVVAAAPTANEPYLAEAVHHVGHETAEMRALIDQQDRMIAKCRADASKCDVWARNALLLGPVDAGAIMPAPQTGGNPLSAPWLQRLTIPENLPVRDDPSLLGFYEYVMKNARGRADMQQLLFSCSKYVDLFEGTLKKYDAPGWLKAVAFQESHCNPEATSPVGARGLWQFMPDSARAYGLMVNDEDVDERLNPAKSTDAAIHFLTDLHAKLGAWDLTLAAYNMGPYAVAQRIVQVGGTAGFWDLRRSDLLPKETAEYVPAIEVYALVFENRVRLGFAKTLPLAESASELNVKPGTRLSLIARVARTSTQKIKELNRDFLSNVVPARVTTARVPVSSDQAFQVQQDLNNWPADDTRDTCAPRDYVWGSGDFELTPYAKRCTQAPPP